MSLETDLLLDRRRLKRRLVVLAQLSPCSPCWSRCWWRCAARAGDSAGAHLARLTVSGMITEDRKLDEAVTKLADNDSVKALIVVDRQPGRQRGGRRGPARRDRARRREEAGRRGDGRHGGIGRLHGRGARRADLRARGHPDRLDRRAAGNRRGVRPAEDARHRRRGDHLRPAEGPAELHQAADASRAGTCCRAWSWTCTTSSSAWSRPAGTWMPRGCANWPMGGPIPGGRR